MGKILLKAVSRRPEKIDKSAVRALNGMRQYFRQNPFPKWEKELEQAPGKEDSIVRGPMR